MDKRVGYPTLYFLLFYKISSIYYNYDKIKVNCLNQGGQYEKI